MLTCRSCLSPLAEGNIETHEGKQVCRNCGAPLSKPPQMENSGAGDLLDKAPPKEGGEEGAALLP